MPWSSCTGQVTTTFCFALRDNETHYPTDGCFKQRDCDALVVGKQNGLEVNWQMYLRVSPPPLGNDMALVFFIYDKQFTPTRKFVNGVVKGSFFPPNIPVVYLSGKFFCIYVQSTDSANDIRSRCVKPSKGSYNSSSEVTNVLEDNPHQSFLRADFTSGNEIFHTANGANVYDVKLDQYQYFANLVRLGVPVNFEQSLILGSAITPAAVLLFQPNMSVTAATSGPRPKSTSPPPVTTLMTGATNTSLPHITTVIAETNSTLTPMIWMITILVLLLLAAILFMKKGHSKRKPEIVKEESLPDGFGGVLDAKMNAKGTKKWRSSLRCLIFIYSLKLQVKSYRLMWYQKKDGRLIPELAIPDQLFSLESEEASMVHNFTNSQESFGITMVTSDMDGQFQEVGAQQLVQSANFNMDDAERGPQLLALQGDIP
ncbi:hypothetical protein HDE_00326 [Halotydeus destructor]|nr:hypothetical protein HDE_00326 [Halotydeus destructor]